MVNHTISSFVQLKPIWFSFLGGRGGGICTAAIWTLLFTCRVTLGALPLFISSARFSGNGGTADPSRFYNETIWVSLIIRSFTSSLVYIHIKAIFDTMTLEKYFLKLKWQCSLKLSHLGNVISPYLKLKC